VHDVVLAATENNWRLFMMRRSDPAFISFQNKIHIRDNNTCQFCGFQAESYFETINLNGNYMDNKRSNLATACGFCAQCFFLEAVGKSDFGGGVLIYLPEISQAQLNAFCHTAFCAMACRLQYAIHAKNIYRGLKMRTRIIEEKIGEGFSNPAQFGQMIIDATGEKLTGLHEMMHTSLRLLPNMARFSTEIVAWAKAGVDMFGDVYKGNAA